MKPVFRWGNMPKPIAQFHKKFRAQFLGEEEAEDDFASVWECSNPIELIEWMKIHPLINDDDMEKSIQPIIDKKNGRCYIVGIALGDRITVGDIDPKTLEIIPGYKEQHPMIVFAQVSEGWLKAIIQSRSKTSKQINKDLVGGMIENIKSRDLK